MKEKIILLVILIRMFSLRNGTGKIIVSSTEFMIWLFVLFVTYLGKEMLDKLWTEPDK